MESRHRRCRHSRSPPECRTRADGAASWTGVSPVCEPKVHSLGGRTSSDRRARRPSYCYIRHACGSVTTTRRVALGLPGATLVPSILTPDTEVSGGSSAKLRTRWPILLDLGGRFGFSRAGGDSLAFICCRLFRRRCCRLVDHRLYTVEEILEHLAFDGLVLDESLGDGDQLVAVSAQNLPSNVMRVLDDSANLAVNFLTAVASLKFRCSPMSRPRNTISSLWPRAMGPSFELMP